MPRSLSVQFKSLGMCIIHSRTVNMMRTMLFSILEDEDHCLEASILLTKIQSLNISSSNYFQRASIRSASVKKLRRQLQGKRLIKTELCVKLSLLRLFHVDHVAQNRRSAFSLACHEWFSCKGKEGKIYCCELPLSSKPQI